MEVHPLASVMVNPVTDLKVHPVTELKCYPFLVQALCVCVCVCACCVMRITSHLSLVSTSVDADCLFRSSVLGEVGIVLMAFADQ